MSTCSLGRRILPSFRARWVHFGQGRLAREAGTRFPIAFRSPDFCYPLRVLPHVPDSMAGIRSCTALPKPGAPSRPTWFRPIWRGVRARLSAGGDSTRPRLDGCRNRTFCAMRTHAPDQREIWRKQRFMRRWIEMLLGRDPGRTEIRFFDAQPC